MKKLNLKQCIISFLCGSIFFGTVSFATMKTIEVYESDIKIVVNGEEVETDVSPFIYNARTFVPVRFVTEALGMEVKWNETTNTVEINSNNIESLSMSSVNIESTIPTELPEEYRYCPNCNKYVKAQYRHECTIVENVYEDNTPPVTMSVPKEPIITQVEVRGGMINVFSNNTYYKKYTENNIEFFIINDEKYMSLDSITHIRLSKKLQGVIFDLKDAPIYQIGTWRMIPYNYYIERIKPLIEN